MGLTKIIDSLKKTCTLWTRDLDKLYTANLHRRYIVRKNLEQNVFLERLYDMYLEKELMKEIPWKDIPTTKKNIDKNIDEYVRMAQFFLDYPSFSEKNKDFLKHVCAYSHIDLARARSDIISHRNSFSTGELLALYKTVDTLSEVYRSLEYAVFLYGMEKRQTSLKK
ncbi:MAG: hypothetical protein Q8O89_07335 [Nanoarchaeota archaeon]|nr:hypothetical protein [Nanoarchaeota archaeon]